MLEVEDRQANSFVSLVLSSHIATAFSVSYDAIEEG